MMVANKEIMMRMIEVKQWHLKDIIEFLEQQDQDRVLPIGFYYAHSYRGYYEDLAFEPAKNVKVSLMLKEAKEALKKTFFGWKGGEYHMHDYSTCWLAYIGCEGEQIGPVMMAHLFGLSEYLEISEME
jgi:hypothetical protein